MKKLFRTFAAALLLSSTAIAVPSLQLDIVGGTYVGGSDETTYSNGPVFTLVALGLNPSGDYFISAAIVPKTANPPGNFGSFTLNGVTYDNNTLNGGGTMLFGTPPVDDPNKNPSLVGHGIFETAFGELKFQFVGGQTVPSYNTQDGGPAGPPGELLNYVNFNVDVSGLAAGYAVHFDLYSKEFNTNGPDAWTIGDFAPFSHDAQSRGVPDGGATLMLLGLALGGLGSVRRYLVK